MRANELSIFGNQIDLQSPSTGRAILSCQIYGTWQRSSDYRCQNRMSTIETDLTSNLFVSERGTDSYPRV